MEEFNLYSGGQLRENGFKMCWWMSLKLCFQRTFVPDFFSTHSFQFFCVKLNDIKSV